jgi:hypothetical protein
MMMFWLFLLVSTTITTVTMGMYKMSKKPLYNTTPRCFGDEIQSWDLFLRNLGVDINKPVQVYRNLHRKCFSVRQSGIVRFHVLNILLYDARFIVGKAGRDRVRREKKKNVHAYVKGFLSSFHQQDLIQEGWYEVRYNPYTQNHFQDLDGNPVMAAQWVQLQSSGPAIRAFQPFSWEEV